ncbi:MULTISPECIES: CoA transferase [unclassified Saccharopolyspora]|uniref:CoA transferase n=1 Tax=unclassified Saccharopolyspora TaxID=2646250 RepID=UPI001CD2B4AB|nr:MULTISPECIES: CoA transferase [unclassified Saccharopolyspora]MCA1186309.1 CoA transferase [Saccharopolyspora sp. 6T]MCA1192172.1 CoA transferase [Saccharopolyspora sp. 6V]MCA1225805.1 CoA transferase [Saccharopolyspora sp. 6M]MCA1279996.1 CoA transferase [Saccharopolyspora sp. 7B]
MSLTDRVTKAVAEPSTSDEFDPAGELAEVLGGVGMSAADTGGSITFHGADPVVPSTLRLGGGSAIALAAKSAAIAKLWRLRGGEGQDIEVDLRSAPHRLCPFYDRRWELVNGYPAASAANPSNALGFAFYRTADDRWVMPLNPYPKIKIAAQKLLGVPDDAQAVAKAISGWNALDLENAAVEAGTVLPMLRSTEELLAEPHYRDALADLPLIEITKIGESEPEPLTGGGSPLDGIRALGMGHVIAGAGVGRALALHGADVLNLWRPGEMEHDTTYVTANVGTRSATVDPYGADGSRRIRELLAGADVFFANRRPGFLDSIGLSAEQAAEARPGIVHATTTLNGERGPWAGRVGFDQTAGSLTGMMNLEGDGETPALPPILVVNDYIVSWLMATGVAEALARRAVDGGSYRVHVSLTRAALWILSLGVFDKEYAAATAGSDARHAYLDPETFTAETPLGHYQGVTDQVRMSATPGHYRTVLVPRGSSRPEWLDR